MIIMQENRSFDSYFGTFPGRRRDPGRRVRPRPAERQLRAPVPRSLRPQLRRPPFDGQRRGRHRQRPDGRVRRPGRAGDGLQLTGPELQPLHRDQPYDEQPAVMRRRDGLPRRARDPQLLDVRRGLRAPGPHVRAQRLLEPPRPPVHGLRVVGVLYEPVGPVVLSRRRPEPQSRLDAQPPASRPRTTASCCTPGPTSPTCCTSRTSPGPTTCSRAPSPTARTTPR